MFRISFLLSSVPLFFVLWLYCMKLFAPDTFSDIDRSFTGAVDKAAFVWEKMTYENIHWTWKAVTVPWLDPANADQYFD